MSEIKVKELQSFVDDFHNKLKYSFKLYENRIKNDKYLKKNFSQGQFNDEIRIRNKFPTISVKDEDNKTTLKNDKLININKSIPWKPPKGTPDYFEEFKCLPNKYVLCSWDKVSKYLFNIKMI